MSEVSARLILTMLLIAGWACLAPGLTGGESAGAEPPGDRKAERADGASPPMPLARPDVPGRGVFKTFAIPKAGSFIVSFEIDDREAALMTPAQIRQEAEEVSRTLRQQAVAHREIVQQSETDLARLDGFLAKLNTGPDRPAAAPPPPADLADRLRRIEEKLDNLIDRLKPR